MRPRNVWIFVNTIWRPDIPQTLLTNPVSAVNPQSGTPGILSRYSRALRGIFRLSVFWILYTLRACLRYYVFYSGVQPDLAKLCDIEFGVCQARSTIANTPPMNILYIYIHYILRVIRCVAIIENIAKCATRMDWMDLRCGSGGIMRCNKVGWFSGGAWRPITFGAHTWTVWSH